jgi:hypothetical protein
MNEAFRILTRRKTDNSILGQPFYKLLVQEQSERPRMATCHSPLGDFDEHVVRLLQSKTMTTTTSKDKDTETSYLVCKIQVKPIFNLFPQTEPANQCLLHYAVVLEEVKVPDESPSFACIPMRVGSSFPLQIAASKARYKWTL